MKFHQLCLVASLSPIFLLSASAQVSPGAPPPAPADTAAPLPPALAQMGVPSTRSSRVSAVVYGPQGEVQALILRDGVAVSLAPDFSSRLQTPITKGTRVQVIGTQRVIAGQTSLVAQALTVNGQTFTALIGATDRGAALADGVPPPPPDPAGPRGRRGPDAPPPAPGGGAPPPLGPRNVVPPPPPLPGPPEGSAAPPPPTGVATQPPPLDGTAPPVATPPQM